MQDFEIIRQNLIDQLYLDGSFDFESMALEVFQFQYKYCKVYKNYCNQLQINAKKVNELKQIPFLPISFFKSHEVVTGKFEAKKLFTSSGTTLSAPSKHLLRDTQLYEQTFTNSFEKIYGPIKSYCVLALLPSYLERDGSSLIYMVQRFIEKSQNKKSGFFLYNHEELNQTLNEMAAKKTKTLLIGVSFALLDFIATFHPDTNSKLIVMETGGMKGRKKEIIRTELHEQLSKGFGLKQIHSEYGMTELLSQAYAEKNGQFNTSKTLQVLIRNQDDPFTYCGKNEVGGINLIDLANIDSCAFIQSDDLGKIRDNGKFEVLGRFDNSLARGCNLLLT